MGKFSGFLLKCLWVIGIPPLLMLLAYLAVDPFMVLRDYDDYFGPSDGSRLRTGVNKGMVTFRNYTANDPERHYDSFILGSSVSVPYRVEHWQRYIGDDSRPVHFDSSSESVRSLRLKLEYLQSRGADLRHVLIVAPPQWLSFDDSRTPPYINMPQIDPDVSWPAYHWMYLRSFYNREFFRAYVMAKIMGRDVRVGTVTAIDTQPCSLDPVTNEETHPVWDDSVRRHPQEFYAHRPDFDKPRVPVRLPAALTSDKEADLRTIAGILERNRADYAVVIGPTLLKQMPAQSDLDVMRDIFGDNLYDMSSTMAHRADADTCFFDFIHYRYPVAAEIIDSIYLHR